MDTAEYENFPQNNAVISVNADDVWLAGYDGTGVKVGILDSGIDTYYDGTKEFPPFFERMDYSNYASSTDPIVTVLLVTDSCCQHVLARGINSISRKMQWKWIYPHLKVLFRALI